MLWTSTRHLLPSEHGGFGLHVMVRSVWSSASRWISASSRRCSVAKAFLCSSIVRCCSWWRLNGNHAACVRNQPNAPDAEIHLIAATAFELWFKSQNHEITATTNGMTKTTMVWLCFAPIRERRKLAAQYPRKRRIAFAMPTHRVRCGEVRKGNILI